MEGIPAVFRDRFQASGVNQNEAPGYAGNIVFAAAALAAFEGRRKQKVDRQCHVFNSLKYPS